MSTENQYFDVCIMKLNQVREIVESNIISLSVIHPIQTIFSMSSYTPTSLINSDFLQLLLLPTYDMTSTNTLYHLEF
jgi:hypothetical protein